MKTTKGAKPTRRAAVKPAPAGKRSVAAAKPTAARRSVAAEPAPTETGGTGAAFAVVVDAMAGKDGVERGTSFGARSLRTGGKVFAMDVKGRLVVKLPRARIAELVDAGTGQPFGMGGRVMKDWVEFQPGHGDWRRLAREAFSYVAGPT